MYSVRCVFCTENRGTRGVLSACSVERAYSIWGVGLCLWVMEIGQHPRIIEMCVCVSVCMCVPAKILQPAPHQKHWHVQPPSDKQAYTYFLPAVSKWRLFRTRALIQTDALARAHQATVICM